MLPRRPATDGSYRLPLKDEEPEVFKVLPEYFLENIVSNYKFIFRWRSAIRQDDRR